jgi:hypothetical protein
MTTLKHEIEILRELSKIERKAGHTQSTWQLLRDIAARLEAMPDTITPLKRAQRLFNEALPKFNWGASSLDANAIALLNEVPGEVARALK